MVMGAIHAFRHFGAESMSFWNWLSDAAHNVTAPLRVIAAPAVAATRFFGNGIAAVAVGQPVDRALSTGAHAAAAGFADDLATANPLLDTKQIIQSAGEIKDGDPKKLSKSVDKIVDNFTANTWTAGKKFLDSTKLTNLQETQENAVKSFQKGDIGGGIENTLNLNPISNGVTKVIENPEQIQPPSGESVASVALLPLDYKTKGFASKIIAVSDNMCLTNIEKSISNGWNALVQGKIAEASEHFTNVNPLNHFTNGLAKGNYFSNLSAPDKEKVMALLEKGITSKYGLNLNIQAKVASDYGQANQIRESIKDVLDGNFDKVFSTTNPVYSDLIKITGQKGNAALASADFDESLGANEIDPGFNPNELSYPSQELMTSQNDSLTRDSEEIAGNFTRTVRELFSRSDSLTGDLLVNADTDGSPSWFHMHHDDGISDGYLDVGADASGFDSFLLQSGSDLIAPIAEPFADAAAITDLVTGKSSPMETVADPLVAAGPLDAVKVDEPRNNDF